MAVLPPAADAERVSRLLADHPPWSGTSWLTAEERLVPLLGFREQVLAQLLPGTASGLDRVAVGAQRDHLLRVIAAAQGEVLDVVDR